MSPPTTLPHAWQTNTNAGAAEVRRAALGIRGIDDDALAHGHLPDPASKSTLRILARPAIVIQLTRNFDKQRVLKALRESSVRSRTEDEQRVEEEQPYVTPKVTCESTNKDAFQVRR